MATTKNASSDARVRRNAAEKSPTRASRSATADKSREDVDGTAYTLEQRQQMLRDEFRQEALPAAPVLPGWHCCWLTTNSSFDPIHKRMRQGYQPVMVSEVAGFEVSKAGAGQFEGAIACNEMVLFKIPESLYQMIMREFHHDQPMREEESLKSNLVGMQKDSSGKTLGTVEGFEDLAIKRTVPAFAA